MWGWYKESMDPPPTSPLLHIYQEYDGGLVLLSAKYPPPPYVRTIPVVLTPFPVKYSILEDDEVSWVVQRQQLNHSGGPSGMRE